MKSRPPAVLWLAGALIWGACMSGALIFRLALLERLPEAKLPLLTSVYFAGGALAWLLALPLIRFFSVDRRVETRFAAGFLFLGVATVAMTAFLFAMQYRLFYARWHAPPGTVMWMYQFFFTSLGAVYQFATIGLRLAFPLAPVLVLAASLYLASPKT